MMSQTEHVSEMLASLTTTLGITAETVELTALDWLYEAIVKKAHYCGLRTVDKNETLTNELFDEDDSFIKIGSSHIRSLSVPQEKPSDHDELYTFLAHITGTSKKEVLQNALRVLRMIVDRGQDGHRIVFKDFMTGKLNAITDDRLLRIPSFRPREIRQMQPFSLFPPRSN
jgi:hypothetical protein